MGVPSVRLLTPKVMPLSGPIDGITDVKDEQEFELAVSTLRESQGRVNRADTLDNIVKQYFFQIDGASGDRAWRALQMIDGKVGHRLPYQTDMA